MGNLEPVGRSGTAPTEASPSTTKQAYVYDFAWELADERRMQAKLPKDALTPAELDRIRRLELLGAVASNRPPSPIRHLCVSSSACLAQLEAMDNNGLTDMHTEALQAAPYWYTPSLPPNVSGGECRKSAELSPCTGGACGAEMPIWARSDTGRRQWFRHPTCDCVACHRLLQHKARAGRSGRR